MKNSRFYLYSFALLIMGSLGSCKEDSREEAFPVPDQITKDIIRDSVRSTEKTPIEDLIQVDSPLPGARITSPLQIKGKARGTWFFEGDFAVRLVDEAGNEVSLAIATAQEEWMTEDWVDFKATMEFEAPASGTGELVLEKSNPSDMRELDNEFRVPVNF